MESNGIFGKDLSSEWRTLMAQFQKNYGRPRSIILTQARNAKAQAIQNLVTLRFVENSSHVKNDPE